MPLDLAIIRRQFPSLERPAVFFDNPGGTQIAKQSLERINRYLLEHNANHGGHLLPANNRTQFCMRPMLPWRTF